MICSPTAENIARAAQLIRAGELVAFPTETVYGLGAAATNDEAVRRIFEIKQRPLFNPLIVHVHSIEQIHALVPDDCSPSIRTRLDKLSVFWPGPLSVVIPRHDSISSLCSSGLPSVAVRIPSHPVGLAFLKACGVPVAAPSANSFMYVSPTTAAHVQDNLGARIPMILDGGACEVGIESTVLSLLNDPPTILRPGAITGHDIAVVLGLESIVQKEVVVPDTSHAQISPGLLAKHYSPHTKVAFRGDVAISDYPGRVGLISFQNADPQRYEYEYSHVITLSARGDLDEIATGLFSSLREMDKAALDLIIIDRCEERGIGVAIMDRLRRATHHQ